MGCTESIGYRSGKFQAEGMIEHFERARNQRDQLHFARNIKAAYKAALADLEDAAFMGAIGPDTQDSVQATADVLGEYLRNTKHAAFGMVKH